MSDFDDHDRPTLLEAAATYEARLMTTNPEQTMPPLSHDDIGRVLMRAKGMNAHKWPNDANVLIEDLVDAVCTLAIDLATARRQRDERPAGRVVWRGNTADWFAEMDATDSLVAVPVPPGTEVAVVVLAAGGAQSGEGE